MSRRHAPRLTDPDGHPQQHQLHEISRKPAERHHDAPRDGGQRDDGDPVPAIGSGVLILGVEIGREGRVFIRIKTPDKPVEALADVSGQPDFLSKFVRSLGRCRDGTARHSELRKRVSLP